MAGGERGGEIKVSFANVQSLINKVDEVKAYLSMSNCDIFVATETWANDDIGNELLFIDGYEIVARKDREDTDRGRGGGLIVYAKKEVDIWNSEVKTNFHQCLTVKVKKGCEEVNIHVVYRSPNSKK